MSDLRAACIDVDCPKAKMCLRHISNFPDGYEYKFNSSPRKGKVCYFFLRKSNKHENEMIKENKQRGLFQ